MQALCAAEYRWNCWALDHLAGDQIPTAYLSKGGGKGLLFVEELEVEAWKKAAPHRRCAPCLKRCADGLPEGLRGLRDGRTPDLRSVSPLAPALGAAAGAVGWAHPSLRRQVLLQAPRGLTEDWACGNLDPICCQLDEGQYDAIVLAAAGLNKRLGERNPCHIRPPHRHACSGPRGPGH